MKTLEELKEKFNKLNKERGILFRRILELEDRETLKKFTVGNCYLDICKNHFAKVIAIDNDELCAIIDDYINIVWYVSPKQFNFDLTNKSGHTIKINWDDISYVDYNGKVGRVMHSGVKYNERNNSQPASTVGGKLRVYCIPFNEETTKLIGTSDDWKG